MAGLSSPLRLAPPMTPRRAPSPTMSPGGRRARQLGSSEESSLRDLSPETTLRAFTQKPMPFDTTCDEYKIFSCIETLTAAEKDLGARVARAAQRLKSWCLEIEQWGWNGSFEPPSEEYREQRRRSLELRIRDHVGDADLSNSLPPLEYWGSLLSVEVESHEARLDDISDEMIKLDVEELKEHVLDMHPTGRSRPSSAGFEATRQGYMPMDDFSFLITQTLLSALPHHVQLKERLGTWTARITTLREVPRYLDDLKTAQRAMQLAWDAIKPPSDNSDDAFAQWKEAVGTITIVLRDKVGSLGRRLDRMLDTLEGRGDCIPDNWIDVFERVEADYGRWSHDSRSRIIDFDVRRKWEPQPRNVVGIAVGQDDHIADAAMPSTDRASVDQPAATAGIAAAVKTTPGSNGGVEAPAVNGIASSSDFANPSIAALNMENQANPFITSGNGSKSQDVLEPSKSIRESFARAAIQRPKDLTLRAPGVNASPLATPLTSAFSNVSTPNSSARRAKPWFITEDTTPSKSVSFEATTQDSSPTHARPQFEQRSQPSGPQTTSPAPATEIASPIRDDESEFDEGDTAIHHDLEEEDSFVEHVTPVASNGESRLKISQPPLALEESDESLELATNVPEQITESAANPVIITNDGQDGAFEVRPHTPRLRSNSTSSTSSDMSVGSSPPSTLEDSPSVRNAGKRALRAPRPELNAAMSKRRAGKALKDNGIANPPWPPTQFQNSAEDLERKISDILTTIPAHIRLTSGPGADAPEVKPRTVSARGSRQYLRAARSVSGLKSPELTLSPAKTDFDSANAASGRKSAAANRIDNDIKLYHLTQPGKEQPVKLFIRRVGENGERVMVRVGGGWADLGEYLRQYAEHHGRRTASDGKFEILGLEVKNNDNMTSPNRPESKQDKRFSGAYQPTSPTTTPGKTANSSFTQEDAPPNYNSPMGADDTTIPSTNSSQRSWKGNEVGLAGPNAKKLDLSGEKQQWIDGMMKQARTVSGNFVGGNTPAQREERAESRSDSRSDSRTGTRKTDFGDLGKVGGTKRIFLRGGRPSLE